MDPIYRTGNVGIGTTSPNEKLHISSIGSARILLEADTDNVGETHQPRLTFRQDGGIVEGYIGYTGGTNHLRIASTFYDEIDFITNSSVRMTIKESGHIDVGMEITDPYPYTNPILHVKGDELAIIRAEYTGSTATNAIAVYGKSTTRPNSFLDFSGTGGLFVSGFKGVYAAATAPGGGSRIGIHAIASGGTWNYGIYADIWEEQPYDYAGYLAGDVHVTGTLTNPPSDAKLKENIESLDPVLSKLMKLKANTFNYKKTPEYQHMNLASSKQYGFIVQELEKIFPELVKEVSQPSPKELEGGKKDANPITYKAVNYIAMIPILVEAIQKQQQIIEEQEQTIDELKELAGVLTTKPGAPKSSSSSKKISQ